MYYTGINGLSGYTELQFMGAIKDPVVKGNKIPLIDKSGGGDFKVMNCDSRRFTRFLEALASLQEPTSPWVPSDLDEEEEYTSSNSDGFTSLNQFWETQNRQQAANNAYKHPYPGIGGR